MGIPKITQLATKLGLKPKYSDSSSFLKQDLLCLKTISGKIFYLERHTRSLSFWSTLAFLFHLLSFTPSSLCFINMELLTTLHKSNAPCSLIPLCELFLQLGCFCSFLYLTNYYTFFKTQCPFHLCEPCHDFLSSVLPYFAYISTIAFISGDWEAN